MWTAKKIAIALGKKWEKNDFPIHQIQFDTRCLKNNDAFIALDKGHEYLKESNALLTIGERDADIIVKNSYQAFNDLAKYARNQNPCKRIAITGSVGKTTTKHFLSQVLSQVFTIISSEKNYNNHIGVPYTLCQLNPQTEIGIFELGSNHPGEISFLSHLVKPDIVIITNISESHIGHFHNGVSDIIKEKFSIVDGLTPQGIIILAADVQKYNPGYKAIVANEEKLEYINYPSNLPSHHKKNLLLVLEVLDVLEIPYEKIDFSQIALPDGRGVVHSLNIQGKNITLIDDAYNNPFLGLKAALTTLSSYTIGRKVAVISDMGEQGEQTFVLHQQILDHIKTLNIDDILPYGPIFSQLLKQPIVTEKEIFEHLKEGDILLMKGTKSSKLSYIVDKLINY